jgi:hypothetical protein
MPMLSSKLVHVCSGRRTSNQELCIEGQMQGANAALVCLYDQLK